MSFDRVADVYDATRRLPDFVGGAIADRVIAATHAGPDTRFLELGIGTGRIALPFVARGLDYTGVDIAEQMMERLRSKAPADARLTLVNADITHLPLPDATFDVVLAVHVLHLIPEWQKAIEEARRVLAPGGAMILAGDTTTPGTAGEEIRRRWRELVQEEGHTLRPRYTEWDRTEIYLIDSGAWIADYRIAQWEREGVPAELIDALHRRVFSQTWDVPQDILDRAHERLVKWAENEYGDIAQPRPTGFECMLAVCRW